MQKFLIILISFSLLACVGQNIPKTLVITESAQEAPNEVQIKQAIAEFWESKKQKDLEFMHTYYVPTNKRKIPQLQATVNPWLNPEIHIYIQQCNEVLNTVVPSYLCDLGKIAEPFSHDNYGREVVNISPVPFRFEEGKWQLKSPLFNLPTTKEIVIALNKKWQAEKKGGLSFLKSLNKRADSSYAKPVPGLMAPGTESETAYLARVKKAKSIPNAPFSEKNLRVADCKESAIGINLSGYTCKLNKDDLKAIFPQIKIPEVTLAGVVHKREYEIFLLYKNKEWRVSSRGSMLTCEVLGECNWMGCGIPSYEPKEWLDN